MSTTDWEAGLEKLLRDIRFVDKTSFEELPGDVQINSFIREVEKRAEERGRNEAVKILQAFHDDMTLEQVNNGYAYRTEAIRRLKAHTPNEATEARGEEKCCEKCALVKFSRGENRWACSDINCPCHA